jgi:hypothetical protein
MGLDRSDEIRTGGPMGWRTNLSPPAIDSIDRFIIYWTINYKKVKLTPRG